MGCLVVLTLWRHCATNSLLVWDHMRESGNDGAVFYVALQRPRFYWRRVDGMMRQAEQDLHMASHHTHQHSALSPARVGWHPEQPWPKEVRQDAHVSIVHTYLLFFNVSKSVLNVNRAAKKGAVVLTITSSEDFSPLSGRGVSCLSGFISNRSNFPHWFWAHSTVCIATQSKAIFALWSNTGNGIENEWMECKCKKANKQKT